MSTSNINNSKNSSSTSNPRIQAEISTRFNRIEAQIAKMAQGITKVVEGMKLNQKNINNLTKYTKTNREKIERNGDIILDEEELADHISSTKRKWVINNKELNYELILELNSLGAKKWTFLQVETYLRNNINFSKRKQTEYLVEYLRMMEKYHMVCRKFSRELTNKTLKHIKYEKNYYPCQLLQYLYDTSLTAFFKEIELIDKIATMKKNLRINRRKRRRKKHSSRDSKK